MLNMMKVKEFWILFVMREKAKYFYATEFYKGVQGNLFKH